MQDAMDMKPWGDMNERERDAAVAVHVMGWVRRQDSVVEGVSWWEPPDGSRYKFMMSLPRFSFDPEDDYQVLKHVRENSEFGGWNAVAVGFTLSQIWRDRCPSGQNMIVQYEPGDYSHAAYEVVRASRIEEQA